MTMDNVKDYTIVEADSAEKLTSMVNDYINDFWFPLGGLQVINKKWGDNEVATFYQALVKYYPQKK